MSSRPADPADDSGEQAKRPAEGLEDVLAKALERLDDTGKDGLLDVIAAHPEHAAALRDALGHVADFDRVTAPTNTECPERLGEYTIKSQLGAGGMGVVYLAEQDSLGREVALKVVRPEFLLFEGARERFRREIDAVARMDHPGIVPILARGASDGVPWYVMPRLRGCSGERILAALRGRSPGALTGSDLRAIVSGNQDGTDVDEARAAAVFAGPYWQAAVRLIRGAALAIRHAHARGVLHRDLKPSNLMFTPSGEAIVLDFGLAHARGDDRVTRTGTTAGSPAYMAPEQLRGEPADERTDIYGLAVTLYSLLALGRPFPELEGDLLRQRLLAGNPDGLRGRRDLPPELRLVLECALDVDRGRRYQDAEAFADDLQAVLDSRPIQARRLPIRIRLRRFTQRHAAFSTAVAASIVVGIGALGVFAWQQSRSNAALQAQIERANDRTKTTIDAVRRLLADVGADQLRNRGAIRITTRLFEDALVLLEDLTDDPVHGAEARLLYLRTHCQLAENAGHLNEIERAVEHCEQVLAALGDGDLRGFQAMLRGMARARLIAIRLDHGDLDGIEAEIEAAETDLELAIDVPNQRDHVLGLLSQLAGNRVRPALERRDVEAAEAAQRRAVAIAAQIGRPAAASPGATAAPTPAIAPGHAHGDPTATASPADASADASTNPSAAGAPYAARHATARLNLVRFLKNTKRFAEATAANDAMLDSLPPADAAVRTGWPTPAFARALALNERSSIAQQQRQDADAITAARAAIELLDQLVARYPEVPEVPKLRSGARGNLALLLARRGDWEPAIELATGAVDDVERVLRTDPKHPESGRLLAFNLRLLCAFTMQNHRWEKLEQAALKLGELEIPPDWRVLAATGLLRQPDLGSRPDLRERALTWLEQACAAGHRLKVASTAFDAIRDEPRFQALTR